MKYLLIYRYKKSSCLGFVGEWKTKQYIANDKNDLIEKLNSCFREYYCFYIIDIKKYNGKEL